MHRIAEPLWGLAAVQSEKAFAAVQRLIEEGRLPPGSMVSERELMELTQFGRTPVREAIQRLQRDYMLRVHPNKGIEIPGNSVEDQLSRLELRRVIEALAVRLACKRATFADMAEIESMAARLEGEFDLPDYADTVRETHRLIIAATHNPYFGALMAPLQALSRRFWMTHIVDPEREVTRGKALHRSILQGIRRRDPTEAEASSLALNDYLVEFTMRGMAR